MQTLVHFDVLIYVFIMQLELNEFFFFNLWIYVNNRIVLWWKIYLSSIIIESVNFIIEWLQKK